MRTRSGIGATFVAGLLLLWSSARAGPSVGPASRAAPVHRSSDPYEACGLARAERAQTPSAACLACHDGTATPGRASASAHGGPGGGMHPVDVDYVAAAMGNRSLAPPSALPRSVVLVDGRVACTTCHDGTSASPFHVAGELVSFCTSCHRM